MAPHPLAGKPAPKEMLVDVPALVSRYYVDSPNPAERGQRVAFGTSGHRGSSLSTSFNEAHILATVQAICEYREANDIDGPLFLGKDTHALSEPAFITALEVLAANLVEVRVDADGGTTPTPVVSHAIVRFNQGGGARADGIVLTPSHNPPRDGGIKYNPPHGGPAEGEITAGIEARANQLLEAGNAGVVRVSYARARAAATTVAHDFVGPYVEDLGAVIDLDAVAGAGLRLGVDPMGGAAVGYWQPIAERFGLDIDVVNPYVDPTFSFVPVDGDGEIRMDCSSPYAMAGLIGLRDRYDVAFGNDADTDRHGIVTPSAGLLNPNHFLSAAVAYLFTHRPAWGPGVVVGKTLVSSSMIDRVAKDLGREVCEVPVGFKWFVDGLRAGRFGIAGEESAGATLLRRDGTVWTTDKDGIVLDLLAAEMTARTGKDPGELYRELTERLGAPIYARIDAPATPEQKSILKALSPAQVKQRELAGDPIIATLTEAPGNGAAIGGLKIMTAEGWFAARPSGTEAVYKIYAESFRDAEHLRRIQQDAQAIVTQALETQRRG